MTEFRTLLSNFVKKSSTMGLLRNDGTVDTTSYLSSHQDISGKENMSNKTNSWSNTPTDDNYPTEKLVKDSLDLKLNIGDILDMVYPVGSIYMSVNNTSPQTLFGGTWVQIEDRFLLGAGTTYSGGTTGGAATVTLTSAQSGLKAHGHGMAHTHNHTHQMGGRMTYGTGGAGAAIGYGMSQSTTNYTSSSDNTASSKSTTDNNTASNATEAHNNMPPYLTVYMWKRTG